ncbi:NERD domain-containing protein [Arthrobacter sp. TE12232]
MLTEDRWVEVSPSQFPHEIEGLRYLKSKLPATTPFRAWTNFEFLDSQGRWHEVDALVLARGSLHLIELKNYSGRLYGNNTKWLRDGRRAEESPLLLGRRKAQRFSSRLKDELRSWVREKQVATGDERKIIPFVQESVFLHHPGIVSEMSGTAASHLFGLDERENESNLPGISELILEEPRADRAIGQNQEVILAELMARIGLVQRRERTAGSWIIEDHSTSHWTRGAVGLDGRRNRGETAAFLRSVCLSAP